MIIMSTVTNSYGEELVLVLKSLDVRIFLGLDDVYIEDFEHVKFRRKRDAVIFSLQNF